MGGGAVPTHWQLWRPVAGGVFSGLDGLYDGMVPRDRIKILLTILGAPRTVKLPFDDVERARKRRVFEGDQPEV